jgi:hypothetical protein
VEANVGIVDLLFVASVFMPPAAVVIGVLSLLLPSAQKPVRTYEHRVDPVSH